MQSDGPTETRRETPDDAEQAVGLVVRVDGIACTVELPGGERRRARLAGKVTRRRVATAPVAVGDRVVLQPLDDQFDLVAEILPRRSELVRAEAGGGRLKQVIAANLDLLVIVFALRNPTPVPARLDRFLVIAGQAGLTPLIVVNKVDLAHDAAEVEQVFGLYRTLGYEVLPASVVTGAGIATLRERLRGRLSALVGASGVGKSSLLNAVQPGLRLRTSEVSAYTGKGRHTTTASDLLPLVGGGYVADTPGLKELAIWGVTADEVADYFPELRPYVDECRFPRCTHRSEPDCAVRAAVDAGAVTPSRYESYLKLRDELTERPAWAPRRA